ncbi:MAG: translation initiation factor IF-6 [Candidatus Marsarchaeota archaeon]|jgi:translation initiation factor 6|nr:translation initiation factor IF-6 [Candidatus Marsarchaeota archaeon]MCL5418885.1 translation initiation factor IF-6 [Candidatus Marsarchaeota archaeon]
MEAATYRLNGSEYVGAFATATDRYVFAGQSLPKKSLDVLEETLRVKPVPITISDSNLIGILARANSNGMLLSNLAYDFEVERIKGMKLDMNIAVLDSDLNAVGSDIVANDKIAIVNSEYDQMAIRQIGDVLGVEVLRAEIGGMKTIGANNILTNKGFAINNRSSDAEKEKFDKMLGFSSVRTTANRGSVAIGLSAVANSTAIVVGDETTGYELDRLMEALE